jgi:hypothetical protein
LKIWKSIKISRLILFHDPNIFSWVIQEENNSNKKCMSALKVMYPILLCWPTMLEADAGGMAVEVEPSCQQI